MLRGHYHPSLYSHPEQPSGSIEGEDGSWDPRTGRGSGSVGGGGVGGGGRDSGGGGGYASTSQTTSSSRHGRNTSGKMPSTSSSSMMMTMPAGQSHSSTQAAAFYSQFVRRYRSAPLDGMEPEDPRNDPDSNYYDSGLGQLDDDNEDDEDDEEDEGDGNSESVEQADSEDDDEDEDGSDGASLADEAMDEALDDARSRERLLMEPTSEQQEIERMHWQTLLASVLSGDVLKSEKARVGVALDTLGEEQHLKHINIWLGIRAKFHGRTVEEERQKLNERRLRTVDNVIQEVLTFCCSTPDDVTSALNEVANVRYRLDVVQSLYPNLKAMYLDKPVTAEPQFQSRCDTLNTWYSVVTTLKHHFSLLRRWTGSESLDVTAPYTSHEVPIGHRNRHNAEPIDGTSFVERLLKEESMQITFEKGSLVTVHAFLGAARDAQVNLAGSFREMNLPTFEKELVPLISFPTRLAQAGLRLRLDYVQKLRDPDVLIIDQMIEDVKLSIGLACTLKRQYEAILAPDPNGNWQLPQCISEDYDLTILEALGTFFRLIHLKLMSGAKSIYFKEIDVLESQWATFNDVSLTAAGGSSLVAEQIW